MAAWPTRTRGGRSNSRTRAGNYGGTSTTCSPTPTSRWASIAPISSLPRRPRSVARTSSPTRAEVCADGDPHRRGSCRRVSKRVHGDRSVGQLVPFDPDDEHVVVPVLVGAFVGRAYLMRVAAVPPRATPGQDVDRRSVRSQANLTAAGHSRGTPDQTPTHEAATSLPDTHHQGTLCPRRRGPMAIGWVTLVVTASRTCRLRFSLGCGTAANARTDATRCWTLGEALPSARRSNRAGGDGHGGALRGPRRAVQTSLSIRARAIRRPPRRRRARRGAVPSRARSGVTPAGSGRARTPRHRRRGGGVSRHAR